MLTLLFNGSPAPSSYQIGTRYVLSVVSSDGLSAAITWTLARLKESPVSGTGLIDFTPSAATVYYLNAVALKSDGTEEEAIFGLQVLASGSPSSRAFIRWSSYNPQPGQPLSAAIQVFDPSGAPPRSIFWSRLFNNTVVLSGTGTQVVVSPVQPGIYRIQATVVDAKGDTLLADSSVVVAGAPEVQSCIVPPQPDPTLQFMGEVYSPWVVTAELLCTYLPYELASISAATFLLPGTTHWQPEIEGAVDDEAVLRTQTGNWTLVGPPTGFSNETVPYDYQHNQPYVPAPLDEKLRYTIDAWNAHGLVATAQRFRVKFKCYRQSPALYQYEPCAWSAYPGGEGQRQRRFVALVTRVDVECDAELHANRTGSGIQTFQVPEQTELRCRLETTGAPDQVFQDDRFYTAQTVVCSYEAQDACCPDLKVNAVYGLAGVRPSFLDFGQAAYPRAIQKLKRLHGKLQLFVAGGGFASGTRFTARVYTGKGPGFRDYALTAYQSVYAPDYDRYVKVTELSIDLSDAEFERQGLLVDFFVNEVYAGTTVPSYYPLPKPGEDSIYSTINAPAIMVDGACFSNPVSVPVFAGTWAASGTQMDSCAKIECGPLGLYCYTELDGTAALTVRQPLGFPAPFVAPQYNQSRCYANPAFLYEITETGTTAPVLAYTGTSGCGIGYRYDPCDSGSALVVIYPTVAVPHSFVAYGSLCYGFTGSIADLRPYTTVTASSVTAVASCQDYACTGSNASGPAVVYRDVDSSLNVNVEFPNLDRGIARWGAVPQREDAGYGQSPPQVVRCEVSVARSEFLLFTAQEPGTFEFRVEPVGFVRRLIVLRGGHRTHYTLQPGLPHKSLAVQSGDQVWVSFVGLRQTRFTGEALVRYEKFVGLPRLYHTAVVAQAGTSAIQALGFCGLNSRDGYAFFGTLPTEVEQSAVNPDSCLTVQGTNTVEMVLVRGRAYGEPSAPNSKPYYAGQAIAGPMTFRFYAERSQAGRHGEMDLWLQDDQPFPAYLQNGPHQVVAYGTYSYRRDAQQGDLSRRALRVASSATGIQYPRIHVSDLGERLPVMTSADNDYVFRGSEEEPFVFTGTLDRGVSDNVQWNLPGSGPPAQVASIFLSSQARSLVYVPNRDQIWVHGTGFDVWGLNAKTLAISQYFSAGPLTRTALVYVPTLDRLLRFGANGKGYVFDMNTGLDTPWPSGFTVTGLASTKAGCAYYHAPSDRVYLAGDNLSSEITLFVINPHTLATEASYNTGSLTVLNNLVYIAATNELCVHTESGGSWAFNLESLTMSATSINMPGSSNWWATDAPRMGRVYIASGAYPGFMYEYDPILRVRTRTFTPPVSPVMGSLLNCCWHPARRRIYVNAFMQSVQVVSTNGVYETTLPASPSSQWRDSIYVPEYRRIYTVDSGYVRAYS